MRSPTTARRRARLRVRDAGGRRVDVRGARPRRRTPAQVARDQRRRRHRRARRGRRGTGRRRQEAPAATAKRWRPSTTHQLVIPPVTMCVTHCGDTFETPLVVVTVTCVQIESRGGHTRGCASRHYQIKTPATCPIPSRKETRDGIGQMALVLTWQ